MKIQITNKMLKPNLLAPKTDQSAGIDLYACIDSTVRLQPGEIHKFNSGIRIAIDPGYVGCIFPRSSTGLKGLWLANITGIIDSDYRGDVVVAIKNTSKDEIAVNPMDRIAQLVVMPHYIHDNTHFVPVLDVTERGDNGFGSTGK